MDLAAIQQALRDEGLDGWLFFDHHRRDPLAYRILGLDASSSPTRRWYYFVPVQGEPRGLVHRIESGILGGLPGRKAIYARWSQQTDGLKALLAGAGRVAMAYSRDCAIPYVALVDAGTVELVRSFGVEVVSAADLIQRFEARWSQAKLDSHLEAAGLVDRIRREAFIYAGDLLRAGRRVDEYAIRTFILMAFERSGLTTEHGPIVAVNENISNPHYEPAAEGSREVRRGDVLLIDLWARLDRPGSVYYDITWTGFCGPNVPDEVRNVFHIVREARDTAVRRVQSAVGEGAMLRGFEVDDAARNYIADRGFADYFVHRTGHSIGEEVHGAGANMDNFETHDERRIIPWTCFSIEPGIYLPGFGIRSEVNVFVDERAAKVTGEIQDELVTV